ncbi:S-layer homology domain-containing protein [Paeniglutamicibacter antarcticus]|uniref:S-layer homology domain-containing protein n=1 Tax=Arthrobacter terrae TaxID=2935737 RepID=A0A931CIC3_9MICC|nr:S-layer homology domain-containing protein [Arthrobacter terrae]MBG0738858.1 S-layer homology domain-containing protein [Arthrobacter terrae]
MNDAWARCQVLKRFIKQDRGSIILEGVVSLGIISVLTLGYTNVSAQASTTQRTAVNESIAVQAAQDALEKAKATSWSKVGTDTASAVALPSGVTPVLGGVLPSTAAPVEVRGLPVTVRTAVGWQKKPSGTSAFGTKLVIVEVSWQDVTGDPTTAHRKPQQIYITPGIGEAVPAGIRSSTESAPSPAPTPTPTPTPTPPPPPPAPSSTFFVPPAVSPFKDVATDNAFYKEITWMESVGISTGYPESDGKKTYRPLSTTNRDAMAAFIYREMGSPAFTAPAVPPYTDITPATQFYKEITWLKAAGYTPGWSGTYSPLTPVTRSEMAAMMYRMAGSPAFTAPTASPFSDVSTGYPFYKEITWMRTTGISTGYPDGTFKPSDQVARDGMSAFFYRFDGKFGK